MTVISTIIIISSIAVGIFKFGPYTLIPSTEYDHSQKLISKLSGKINLLKKKQQEKTTKAAKRFVKKTSIKMSKTAISSATIGTIAAVGITAAFSAEEYCNYNEELIQDYNLLFGTNKEFSYDECYGQALKDLSGAFTYLKDEAIKHTETTWDSTVSKVNKGTDQISQTWYESIDYSDKKIKQFNTSISEMYQETKDNILDY